MEWKLSVDLDNVPYWKVLQTYFNMKYFFGKVRIFRTSKGYHFEADVPTSIEARLLLGDDDYRLWLSEVRSWVSGYLDDVTFDWKYEMESGGVERRLMRKHCWLMSFGGQLVGWLSAKEVVLVVGRIELCMIVRTVLVVVGVRILSA